MATEKEEKKLRYQPSSCLWLIILVVVLLLALAYFAIYRDKSLRRGGKWSARGGCACQAPPI